MYLFSLSSYFLSVSHIACMLLALVLLVFGFFSDIQG